MTIRNLILPQTYNDSIVLMQYTVELEALPGVDKAAIMMGTPAVLQFLEENALLAVDKKTISADAVVLAAVGEDASALDEALQKIAQKLRGNELQQGGSGKVQVQEQTRDEGILWREVPAEANVALISVPGQYAAAEAWQALRSNRHVMIFSNDVSLADEIALKKAAQERGLFVMGPDCGTAMINGVPLGFANVVRGGDIGVVAAAGSGLQALTCLVDRLGGGITQAVGTGGRDLKKEVQGITTKMALSMLTNDENTQVIVILSKPPDTEIAKDILTKAKKLTKPVVLCLLGMAWTEVNDNKVHFASTILTAASKAVQLSKGVVGDEGVARMPGEPKKTNGCLRGFYSGGTLAYEAYLLLQKELEEIYSNAPLETRYRVGLDGLDSAKHIILDLGTEEFTLGRAHPMIDGRWRSELIAQTGHNHDVRIVLLDIILGYGADENPAGSIIDSIRGAKETAAKEGRQLAFIAFIVGTERDPQNYAQQAALLKEAGVELAENNEMAVQMAMYHLTEKSK